MNKNKDEILEEREITGNKKKLLLWGSLALVLVILTAALLLIFLLPKGEKYYIETNSSLEVVLEGQGEYAEGEEVTIKAEDIEGYRFRNWTLNGIEVCKEFEYIFKASDETDGTYTANYDKLFKITLQDGEILSTDKTEAIENEEIKITLNNDAGIEGLYYIVEGTSVRVDIVDNKFNMPLGNVTIFISYAEELQKGLVFEIDEENKTADLISAPSDVVVPRSFSYYYKTPIKQYTIEKEVLTLKTDSLEMIMENMFKVMEYFNPMIDSQFVLYSDVLYTTNNGEQSINPIMTSELCAKIVMGEFDENAFPIQVEVLNSLNFDEPSKVLELINSGDELSMEMIMNSPKLLSEMIMALLLFPSSGGIFDQKSIWNSVNNKDLFIIEEGSNKYEVDLETGLNIIFVAYFQAESFGDPSMISFPVKFDFSNLKNVIYTEGDDYIVDGIHEVVYEGLYFDNITIPNTIKDFYSEYDGLDLSDTNINYLGTLEEWLSINWNSDYSGVNFNSNTHLYINGELLTEAIINKKDIDISVLGGDLKKLIITESVNNIYNNSYSYHSYNLKEIIIQSSEIYKQLTSSYSCGSISEYATTIKVLKTIVDNPDNINTYLNNESNFIRTEDSDYYIYTKVGE